MAGKFDDLPDHVRDLIDNLQEIKLLVELKSAITGRSPGKHNEQFEVLTKSALVLTVACWEAYIEDLAHISFRTMMDKATSPDDLPAKVLALAAEPYIKTADSRKIWELSGSGWRNVLYSYQNRVLDQTIGKLNTPRPQQVNRLFEALIGIRSLSSHWYWHGMSNDKATRKLNFLITRRGQVAHRVRAATYVQQNYVVQSTHFIQRLAAITSNRVRDHLTQILKESPWYEVGYGKTK